MMAGPRRIRLIGGLRWVQEKIIRKRTKQRANADGERGEGRKDAGEVVSVRQQDAARYPYHREEHDEEQKRH